MDFDKIVSLVWQAGKLVKVDGLDVKEKNAYDFVTQVDTNVSNFLKESLAKEFPWVGFVTEEEESHVLTSECFILDPVDGTTNLIYDYRQSAISLAYAKDGEVQFGVVYNPFSGEMFVAVRGGGSYVYDASVGVGPLLEIGVKNYKQSPLRVANRDLAHSLVEFGAGSSYKEQAQQNFDKARRVFEHCLDLRRICCTALSICYLAAGRIDGYFERVIKPWDFAAAMLVLHEAGGVSSTWKGTALPLDSTTTILCAAPTIYEELLALVTQGENL
ncbi:MAG: inositol monophosphatase [Clostridia bacterium]|nr:inositol monophosphatase [Clostridia bacterium]